MATLAGQTIAATYGSLLKTSSNTPNLASGAGTERLVFSPDADATDRTPIYVSQDRVGIGVADPDATLEVKSSSDASVAFKTGYDDTQLITHTHSASGNWSQIQCTTASVFYINTNGNSELNLMGGKVGIGDAVPSEQLEIVHATTGGMLSLFRRDADIDSGESLGALTFKGSDVGAIVTRKDAAVIQGKATADWSATGDFDQPTSLLFFTQNEESAANKLLTGQEGLVLDHDNKVGINVSQATTSYYNHHLHFTGTMTMDGQIAWAQKSGANPYFDVVVQLGTSWQPISVSIDTSDVAGNSANPGTQKFFWHAYALGSPTGSAVWIDRTNDYYGTTGGYTVTITDLGAVTVGGHACELNPFAFRIALTGGEEYQSTFIRIAHSSGVLAIVPGNA